MKPINLTIWNEFVHERETGPAGEWIRRIYPDGIHDLPLWIKTLATRIRTDWNDRHVLLVAGRKQGERLFEGALLTLKYFLWPFHRHPVEPCLLRGLDAPGDLAADSPSRARISAYAQAAIHAGHAAIVSGNGQISHFPGYP